MERHSIVTYMGYNSQNAWRIIAKLKEVAHNP